MDDDDDYWYDAAYSELQDKIGKEAVKESRFQLLQRYYLLHYTIAESPRTLVDEANAILHDSPTAAFVIAYAVCEVVTRGLVIKPLIYGSVLDHILSDEITDKAMASIRGHAWPLATTFVERLIGIDISETTYTGDHNGYQTTIQVSETLERLSKLRHRVVHRAQSVTEQDAYHCIFVASRLLGDVFPKILDGLALALCEGKIIYKSMAHFDGEWGRKTRVDHWAEMDASRQLLKKRR